MVTFQYPAENRRKAKKRTSERVIPYNSFLNYALKVTLSHTDDARSIHQPGEP